MLTNEKGCVNITKLSQESTAKKQLQKTHQKNFLKKLKKGIDKRKSLWYTEQAVDERATEKKICTLKNEQCEFLKV